MRQTAFTKFLDTAEPGAEYVYHEGDILPSHSRTVADVRSAYDAGLIELARRRLTHGGSKFGLGTFAYIAQKRRRPARIPAGQRFIDYPDIARRMDEK
jgi:hypothetical protein